ncbi:hypothetical protein J3E68DRAFT_404020 [Trichoderma sp. SZMC 28012]
MYLCSVLYITLLLGLVHARTLLSQPPFPPSISTTFHILTHLSSHYIHTYIHLIPPENLISRQPSHRSSFSSSSFSLYFSCCYPDEVLPPRCNRLLRPLYLQRSCSNPSESRYPNRRSRQHSASASSRGRMPAGQRLPSVCISSTTTSTTTTPRTIASRLS